MLKRAILLLLIQLAVPFSQAVTTETKSLTFSIDGQVPDDGFAPFVFDPGTSPFSFSSISDIKTRITIYGAGTVGSPDDPAIDPESPAPNSDLTASLIFGIHGAVLFDGSATAPPDTFASPLSVGMNVTFSDGASDSIQAAVVSDGDPIIGSFKPLMSLNLTFADPGLALDPNSDLWILNISDLEAGGFSYLVEWDLIISGPASVPDSLGFAGALALGGLMAAHAVRRMGKSSAL